MKAAIPGCQLMAKVFNMLLQQKSMQMNNVFAEQQVSNNKAKTNHQ